MLGGKHAGHAGRGSSVAGGRLSAALAWGVEDAVGGVGEVAVERGHVVLRNSILNCLERGLLGGRGGSGVGELEDVLGQLQVRVLGELRVAHGGWRGTSYPWEV